MKNKFGILQGRLTKAPSGRLQFFPNDWSKEFPIAKNIGFDYIELFSERTKNPKNPIWSLKQTKLLKKKYKDSNLIFYSFIDDYLIKSNINSKLIKYYYFLINKLKVLNIKIFILPFYGKNKIKNQNLKKISNFLNIINSKCKKNKIKLSIESNIDPDLFFKLRKNLKDKIYLAFDTGNRSVLKRDMYDDLRIFNKSIIHVHIKDKNNFEKNVLLGKGMVNFLKLFKELNNIGYKGGLTLETNRLNRPVFYAKKNLNFIKKFIN